MAHFWHSTPANKRANDEKWRNMNISREGGGLETCNVLDLPRDAGREGGVDVCAEEHEEVEQPSE
jgi:hypothetical protein